MRRIKTSRDAFTLIELVVVIAIIAILLSLITAATMKVQLQVVKLQTRVEIGNMEQGLVLFMADYGLKSPPPSFLYLREDGRYDLGQLQDKKTVTFLQTWLGRNFNWKGQYDWNGSGSIDGPYCLFGQQCLVFYLGGVPSANRDGTIGMTGFAKGNNPAASATSSQLRNGPYFDFKSTRLTLSPGGIAGPLPFPVYVDCWNVKQSQGIPGRVPYAYFSTGGLFAGYNLASASWGGDCAITNPTLAPTNGASLSTPAASAYCVTTDLGTPYYANNTGFQILSAGADGTFGNGPSGSAQWRPLGGTPAPAADDQSNFARGTLADGQQ